MIKVITYGTYDLLHYGHIRLLERAKALGDYLIVGITSDDYDRTRGKINNQQSLVERIEAVKKTGLADEIIVEEYEGQKIDDIRKLGIDIFTVGSDWDGYFDYLKDYCKVVYLPRTQGISSSDVRTAKRKLRVGIVGKTMFGSKFINESKYVNGVELTGIYASERWEEPEAKELFFTDDYDNLLKESDAVYIISKPEKHYEHAKKALKAGKHVLCVSPVSLTKAEAGDLHMLAKEKGLIFMDAIKTAYSTAFERMVLLAKTGKIGQVLSVDAVCTSLRDGTFAEGANLARKWSGMCSWAPIALLPVFEILGTGYKSKNIYTKFLDEAANIDGFTKIDFCYPGAVASIKVAKAAKAEGELVITGSKGYIYVPAPWWKTDYFEVRYENPQENRRFYYQLDGEGIRNEIVTFARSIESAKNTSYVSEENSVAISGIIEDFYSRKDMTIIQ